MEYIVKNINSYSDNELNSFYDRIYKYKKDRIDKLNKKAPSIIGEILLSELLFKHELIYDKLDFFVNDNGKPYIKDYFFNISHSYDYVVTALSTNEIGIDIEKIRETNLNTINRFATEKEKSYILSSDTDVFKRLFQIYTLKEAYIKMKGTSLNDILNVEFEVIDDKVICSDSGVCCGFINDIDGYIISYCEKKVI